jgi:large subunit ribosomal protein L24
MHVKKGDIVKVIAGKDKGKSGTIVRAFPKQNSVVVEGVALFKRHMKGRTGQVGRILERPRPINASNVKRTESFKGVKK